MFVWAGSKCTGSSDIWWQVELSWAYFYWRQDGYIYTFKLSAAILSKIIIILPIDVWWVHGNSIHKPLFNWLTPCTWFAIISNALTRRAHTHHIAIELTLFYLCLSMNISEILSSWESLLHWSENASVARQLHQEMAALKGVLNKLGHSDDGFEGVNGGRSTTFDSEASIQVSIDELRVSFFNINYFRFFLLF